MRRDRVRARRDAIVTFISGAERATAEMRKEFSSIDRDIIMADLRLLRKSGIIMRVAPATYALRAEADIDEEHPFVNYQFTNYDRWKCGIKKRERMPAVAELYTSGTPIRDIAERVGVSGVAVRSYLNELGIYKKNLTC